MEDIRAKAGQIAEDAAIHAAIQTEIVAEPPVPTRKHYGCATRMYLLKLRPIIRLPQMIVNKQIALTWIWKQTPRNFR